MGTDTYQDLRVFNSITHAERRQQAYLENVSLTIVGTTFDYHQRSFAGRNNGLYF